MKMTKHMKIETTIANLQKMHDSYVDEVSRLEKEFANVSAKLERYRNLVSRTSESIDALEGKTSLIREQLQQALQTRTEPLNVAVGDVTPRGGSLPSNLPPAEPGMKWVITMEGESVLVPETLQTSFHSETPLIELPPIDPDEEFTDKPTDFVI